MPPPRLRPAFSHGLRSPPATLLARCMAYFTRSGARPVRFLSACVYYGRRTVMLSCYRKEGRTRPQSASPKDLRSQHNVARPDCHPAFAREEVCPRLRLLTKYGRLLAVRCPERRPVARLKRPRVRVREAYVAADDVPLRRPFAPYPDRADVSTTTSRSRGGGTTRLDLREVRQLWSRFPSVGRRERGESSGDPVAYAGNFDGPNPRCEKRLPTDSSHARTQVAQPLTPSLLSPRAAPTHRRATMWTSGRYRNALDKRRAPAGRGLREYHPRLSTPAPEHRYSDRVPKPAGKPSSIAAPPVRVGSSPQAW